MIQLEYNFVKVEIVKKIGVFARQFQPKQDYENKNPEYL